MAESRPRCGSLRRGAGGASPISDWMRTFLRPYILRRRTILLSVFQHCPRTHRPVTLPLDYGAKTGTSSSPTGPATNIIRVLFHALEPQQIAGLCSCGGMGIGPAGIRSLLGANTPFLAMSSEILGRKSGLSQARRRPRHSFGSERRHPS